ncbi:cellulose-binding domain-containing protein [Lentzea sp. HUAS12]|uniref:cellulose-binding domain-containing protein n=1 Tax=Lentzea sp. HUAS12 TaxID=2951806 RepID=UPI00209F891D|nr:cellulose-binding domain-containing protein [Lentzea sp. HUAS12]USX53195.1 cellulose-binding domain-containing protein [Lentzea sp. HUAS12]
MRAASGLLALALLAGCSPPPPAPVPPTRTSQKPPTLVNEQVRAEGVLHFVRDVVDGRTVELADGTKARIAQLAAPPACGEAGALSFARTTLLASAVRISPMLSGDVKLTLEDGTDYALLAVRQGALRAEGTDGGALLTAESEAAAADRGLWGPPCEAPAVAPTTTTVPPPPRLTTTTTTTAAPPPARTCAVSYRLAGQWPGGFQAQVTVRNTGAAPINGWVLRWTFASGQVVTEMWNATPRQSRGTVDAVNAHYNPLIQPGGSVEIGFNGSAQRGNAAPAAFTLNNQPCSVA